MENIKTIGIVCILLWAMVLLGGCSSSDGGSNSSNGSKTYSEEGSNLVLQIDNSLNLTQAEIEEIYYHADLVDHCATTNGDAIDIVLAEACIYYDERYLFPEYFPANLDGIEDVSAYVDYLGLNDLFTYYFSPEDFADVMSFYTGDLASIGFTAKCSSNTVTTLTPLVIRYIAPHTRAWIDGFEVGDSIIEIDGTSILGMELEAVSLLLPEIEGAPVDITVDRDGVEITIASGVEENIGLLLEGDIAYLSVRSFTTITGDEVQLDYEALQEEAGGQIDKLILDLRDNGGGSHTGMLTLVDYLIDMDDGSYPILTRYGPAVEEETEYLGDANDANIGNYDKANFVLLVDGSSASASEIVAAALKYYGTATLIGETTYGKGIGQSIIELIDGSGVVIPAVYSIPPSGESYHGIGIDPDYYMSATPTSFDDDPVLDAAIEYLRSDNTDALSLSTEETIKRTTASEESIDPMYKKLLRKSSEGTSF